MLNKISFIASVISAVTAVTTSLRALGRSRENARYESESKIRTGCRVGDYGHQPPPRGNLRLHLLVTIIWFVLSIIFALPLLSRSFSEEGISGLYTWILLFIIIAVVNILIWRKTLHPGN